MIQHAVLITFKDDLAPGALDEFLAATQEIFADTPFRTVAHGTALGVVPNGADWGYTGLLDSDDIYVWRDHPSHIRLRDHVTPMTAKVDHIQIHVS